MLNILKTLHKLYKLLISPFLGERCRFYPSCSNYALEAIEVHGGIKGSWLGFKRVIRCSPLFEGGLDPVPRKSTNVKNKLAKHFR